MLCHYACYYNSGEKEKKKKNINRLTFSLDRGGEIVNNECYSESL